MRNLVRRTITQVFTKLALDRVIVLGVLAAYVLPQLGVATFTGGIIDAVILAALIAYGSLLCLVPVAIVLLAMDGLFKLFRSPRRVSDFHIGSFGMASINLFTVMLITLVAISLLPFAKCASVWRTLLRSRSSSPFSSSG